VLIIYHIILLLLLNYLRLRFPHGKSHFKILGNRDKMKDDAIAQLSDQVIALTTRMHEIERKQLPYVS